MYFPQEFFLVLSLHLDDLKWSLLAHMWVQSAQNVASLIGDVPWV